MERVKIVKNLIYPRPPQTAFQFDSCRRNNLFRSSDIFAKMNDNEFTAKVEVDLTDGEGEAWVDYSSKEQ